MKDEKIIELVESGVESAIKNNMDLLSTGGVEDTFAAGLRDQLLPLFKSDTVTVDVNYNKHLLATKMLKGNRIEVDLAIHQRFSDKINLVVIELETSNYPKRDDIWKVEELTGDVDGYGYQLGLFLVIGVKKRAGEIIDLIWYKNGLKIS